MYPMPALEGEREYFLGDSRVRGREGLLAFFLAELGKGIKQGLCFLRQGVRKGSLSHPCSGKNGNSVSQGCASVPFPFTCLGREASITCYSASPQSLGRGRESTR